MGRLIDDVGMVADLEKGINPCINQGILWDSRVMYCRSRSCLRLEGGQGFLGCQIRLTFISDTDVATMSPGNNLTLTLSGELVVK